MWPFDFFAKRRAAKEAREQAEHQARMDQVKASIEAENRRQREREAAVSKALEFRVAAATRRQPTNSSTLRSVPSRIDDDFMSPAHPLSPFNPINQAASYSAPADEPRHASSHCGSSSSHSSHSSGDYGSSHSHSSHDHGCSSSSYDSSSSSSYDSGSSSSSSDW